MIVEGMLSKGAPLESTSRYRGGEERVSAHRHRHNHQLSSKGVELRKEETVHQRMWRLYHHCSNGEVVIQRGNISTGNETDTYGK